MIKLDDYDIFRENKKSLRELSKDDCFLQDLFGKKCRTFWRILHLQIGENCRGFGRSFFCRPDTSAGIINCYKV